MNNTQNKFAISEALISVSDKQHLDNLAAIVQQKNIPIISSGGTAKFLQQNNLTVTEVKDYTKHPEILDGRVKTLHPKIFGGILARQHSKSDIDELEKNQIHRINLVIVNLYPFTAKLEQNPNIGINELIEYIDIGGPSLIRAAAKNYQDTIIITDHTDYNWLIEKLNESTDHSIELSEQDRLNLAYKAFKHTAEYDAAISHYFSKQVIPNVSTMSNNDLLNKELNFDLYKVSDLRYGENPDQQAAIYNFNKQHATVNSSDLNNSLANPNLLQGKELSYNNLLDANAAINIIKSLSTSNEIKNFHNCVIIKHNSPCGIASSASSINDAYIKAFESDSRSAFGGIISINNTLTAQLADTIISNQFLEVIIAPSFNSDALDILKNKPNVRVIKYDNINKPPSSHLQYKTIDGGMLIQSNMSNEFEFNIVTENKDLSEQQILDLKLSWYTVQNVKSNAIVLVKNLQTIGIGGGQTSRIGSLELSAHLSKVNKHDTVNSVMASDAFFPFPDSIELANELGVTAIIQPGGSKNDAAVIEAANKRNLIMVFTNYRKFCH